MASPATLWYAPVGGGDTLHMYRPAAPGTLCNPDTALDISHGVTDAVAKRDGRRVCPRCQTIKALWPKATA